MSETKNIGARLKGRASFGWKVRHLVVLLVAAVTIFAFWESRPQWSPMHRWNRSLGDASLILISFSMAIGPLARMWSRWRRLIPFRREFGIHGVLLAVAHTVIILGGWVEWDLVRIFGYELHPQTGNYVMLQQGFALSNVIGIVCLVYGLTLALSSSNWSQRVLGGQVWKFLQQGAYVLWILIVLHTAYFLYLHFQSFHRATPDPNWAQVPFAILVGVVALLQLSAFVKTWREKRGPRIERAAVGG